MILLLRLIAIVGARLPPAAVLWRIPVLVLAILLPALVGQVRAEVSEIGMRRSAERTSFTDAEISEGFFKIAFGAEMQVGPRAERIRKFAEPRAYTSSIAGRRTAAARLQPSSPTLPRTSITSIWR